jgi:signal transduction histidine kinase
MSEPRPVVWYRSFYWRIALGFVVTVGVVLALQAALFLWLASTIDPVRSPTRLAVVAAAELGEALDADPSLDVGAWLTREFGRGLHRVFVVRRDGVTFTSGDFTIPPFLLRIATGRLRGDLIPRSSGAAPGEAEPPPGLPPDGDRTPPRFPRRQLFQFVMVKGQAVAVLGVMPAPPTRSPVLAQFGPALIAAAVMLLIAGTAVMAIVVFRPVHRRLRGLEQAAAAVGAGETAVRADEAGGDEVASLARRFNRMAADLDARVRDLREADRSRRQLLADVSHELMTPLTAIRGYLETLTLPGAVKDDATRTRYLGIVTEETLRLEAIIGDLLDLARLEGGGGAIEHEPVSIAHLFERAFARHQGVLEERGIALERGVDPGAATVAGDERRLEQVVQNLVANAVRHTPAGGRIRLHAAPDPADPSRVTIAIDDSGPGIPAEHAGRVFDRFYRVDPARDARSGGSGLGLSIVRAVVERHGGTVSAANGPLGGARFEVHLPARVSDSGTAA